MPCAPFHSRRESTSRVPPEQHPWNCAYFEHQEKHDPSPRASLTESCAVPQYIVEQREGGAGPVSTYRHTIAIGVPS